MSFKVLRTTEFPQPAFQYFSQEVLAEDTLVDVPIAGGILCDLRHTWQAKGPCLEIRSVPSGRKVGCWTFGGILRDSNTKIVTVQELKRAYGRVPLLVVGLNCPLSGGQICVFDIFGSKVLRVVQIQQQITNIHIIDPACDMPVLPETSPLKYFDGIVAIGTLGGGVFLLDLCKQICENAIQNMDASVRDEINPCTMVILKKEKISNIKKYVEQTVEREEHLAIHLNVVLSSSTEHFTLKGENGEDRVHVNHLEAEISALFYSPQMASLLVGYNFGAFQMWDLRSLELLYTSPICEDHIPVTHFTVQEPADDPKAYCYIWVSYSHNLLFHSGLPYAVMYSFYFENKTFIGRYGNLYENFQHCSIRFQLELGDTQALTCKSRVKGGTCLGFQCINKCLTNNDLNSLALCFITWLIWDSDKEVNTAVLLFDLNQWYKEQMPRMPNWSECSNYIIKNSLSEFLLDAKLDPRSLNQFMGIQRLEEHFCPTSLSFDLWAVSGDSIIQIHNKGLQRAFLDNVIHDSHLALVKPEDYSEQIVSLGLIPLFYDLQASSSMDIDDQRELLLSVALEQKLIGWLCQAVSKLANNAYSASGLTICNLLNWAFQRAVAIKNACDNYCVPLFDYSGMRLDDNTITLVACGMNQVRNLCSFYQFVSNKLLNFVSDKEGLLGEQKLLESVVVYFEVLLWMVNIGLLPEYQPRGAMDNLLSGPYLVEDLTQHYSKKRMQLQMASRETFVEKDCLLFIDSMINHKGAADLLRRQWQEDGGSGLYPPPSLQSVLRTYLLEGADLVFKHSLVTYTLLDIAMTVDEKNKVIKLLLKFPQIFDLSQSNMKIVQAFWHLDHDDYETALDIILDPCVLPEDLQHWHHSVMLQSMLLQGQFGLALVYFQIRKPSMRDKKDLFTIISLLISKNMLDEAFKFRLQHEEPNDETLLAHIFNECNKNELLHELLYRRMNQREENAFFEYLQETRNARCEDLKVFYYLLRSRFLEAFDSYTLTNRKQPDTQGLAGQRNTTAADNIVKMFKTLLPDVNRNLLELVRKERTNMWKEVQKPVPLSVFVHNAKDQVRYKSSVIFAALVKAKETFSNTLNDTQVSHAVVTEDTPFLRTPSVFRNRLSVDTPLLKSKVIEHQEEFGPSPSKRLKLSPRASKASPLKSRNFSLNALQSKLSTPIIKRREHSCELDDTTAVLPQSILKSVSRTILDDSVFDEITSVNTSLQAECENSIRRSKLGLMRRKAVGTPLKSHVKFDDLRYSGNSTETNSKSESIPLNLTGTLSIRSENSTSSVTDDVFYSPDHSSAASGSKAEDTVDHENLQKSARLSHVETLKEDAKTLEKVLRDEPQEINQLEKLAEENVSSRNRMNFQSPKSRKSYKRSFDGDNGRAVRCSPRLARNILENQSHKSTFGTAKAESPVPTSQNSRGHKSLSRSVLEHNAFSALKCSSLLEESSSYGSKSGVDSTFSDLNMDDTSNASLEAFFDKYRDTSLDNYMKNEVLSRTTEFVTVEIHKEPQRANTGAMKESKEEYRSKTVEVFVEEVTKNIAPEPKRDIHKEESKNEESFIQSIGGEEADNVDDNSTEKSFEQERDDKEESSIKNKEIEHEEPIVNIYEDLSSASEDVKEVLQNINEKVYADISCSTSFYQAEKKDSEMPDHILDSGESDNSSGVYNEEDVEMPNSLPEKELPQVERVFSNTVDVIEIDSSATESSSSSGSESNSSDESVRDSEVSDESLNTEFEENLDRIGDDGGFVEEGSESKEDDSEERVPMKEAQKDTSNEGPSNNERELFVGGSPIQDESEEEQMDCLLLEAQEELVGESSVQCQAVSAIISNNEEEGSLKRSISLQCTLASHDAPVDVDTPVQVDKDDTFLLRTVKKTYPARRGYGTQENISPINKDISKHTDFIEEGVDKSECEAPKPEKLADKDVALLENRATNEDNRELTKGRLLDDVDGTPKLAIHLTKRTYIRERAKFFDEGGAQIETRVEEERCKLSNKSDTKTDLSEANLVEDIILKEHVNKNVSKHTDFTEEDVDKNESGAPKPEKLADKDVALLENRAIKEDNRELTKGRLLDDVDGTPKLSIHSTKRTYLRQRTTKFFDEEDDQTKTRVEEEKCKLSDKSGTKTELPEANLVEEIILKEHGAPVNKDVSKHTDVIEEGVDKNEYEATKPEKLAEKDVEHLEKRATEEDFEANPEDRRPELDPPNAQKAPIMTRRRSMLQSQTDGGTSSSVTDESFVSRDSKSSKSALQSDVHQSEASVSQQSTASHSSHSSTRTRRSKRILSESMFDNTVLADSPEKQDLMDTSLISGISKGLLKNRKTKGHEEVAALKKPTRRTRSVSIDESMATSTRKRSLRSKSVDLDDEKIDLKVTLSPITELSTSKNEDVLVPQPKTKPASDFGDYTSSRRLTRRQASILQALGNVEREVRNLPNLETIQPVLLLDKPEFEGQADPEELNVYERSSPSNSSETIISRHTRSTSVLSDATGLSTPTKKQLTKIVDSTILGIKSRLRRPSADTISVASDQSDSPSPPKKARKKEKETGHDIKESSTDCRLPRSGYKTRSRANSESSASSVTSNTTETSAKSKKSRKFHSTSELPKIREEKDEGDSTIRTASRKRSGKK